MEYRELGGSGLVVSAVGMGTWRTFDVSGSDADAAYDRVTEALRAGTNFFDSSPMYDRSESVLGAALSSRREAALVATKVWARTGEEGDEQIARSLEYFGGFVDLFQVHNLLAWQEQLPKLERLREEGKVGALGATHWDHAAFGDLEHVMKTQRVSAVQVPYNPLEQEAARRILPAAADLGLGVVVMRPFAEGHLTRRAPHAFHADRFASFNISTWAQALIKWVLSDPRCHCVIPATSRFGRATENAAAGEPPWFGPGERDEISAIATRAR